MKNILKDYHALQEVRSRCTAAALCMVCTIFFAATGCVRQETSPIETPYYFYKYKDGVYVKTYLRLNTKYATLTVKEPQVPDDILQRGITASKFQIDHLGYWTELSIEKDLTYEQYLELLADIKRQNMDVIIGPYFSTLDGVKAGGTSPSFMIRLKHQGQEILMEQMAEITGSVISYQAPFPNFTTVFTISVTEETILNSMEIANIFFESELFEWVAYYPWFHAEGDDTFPYPKNVIH